MALVFHVFIAVTIMVVVCGRCGIGPVCSLSAVTAIHWATHGQLRLPGLLITYQVVYLLASEY